MKFCTKCLVECLDRENECFQCGNDNLISNSEFELMRQELTNANKYKKSLLLKHERYKAVNDFLEKKKQEHVYNPYIEFDNSTYQCPNCGRTYFSDTIYCGSCNRKLVKQEDVNEIAHPELSERKYKVIGEIKRDKQKSQVQCPYCKSYNTSKITIGARVADNMLWGLFSTKRNKQWKCGDCGSEF